MLYKGYAGLKLELPANAYSGHVDEALAKGIIKINSDDDAYIINKKNSKVKELYSKLDDLKSFIISEDRSDGFREYITDNYENDLADMTNSDLWEELFEAHLYF
jgi:hypothetical protein